MRCLGATYQATCLLNTLPSGWTITLLASSSWPFLSIVTISTWFTVSSWNPFSEASLPSRIWMLVLPTYTHPIFRQQVKTLGHLWNPVEDKDVHLCPAGVVERGKGDIVWQVKRNLSGRCTSSSTALRVRPSSLVLIKEEKEAKGSLTPPIQINLQRFFKRPLTPSLISRKHIVNIYTFNVFSWASFEMPPVQRIYHFWCSEASLKRKTTKRSLAIPRISLLVEENSSPDHIVVINDRLNKLPKLRDSLNICTFLTAASAWRCYQIDNRG